MIQIPKSIAPVAEHISSLVKAYFPCSSSLDDFDESIVNRWRNICNDHELFDQDAERYINDIFIEKQNSVTN